MSIRSLPSIESHLKLIEKALEDIKKVQRVGLKSLKGYKTFSEDSYDWSYTSTTGYKKFRLTFTHAEAKKGAIIKLKAFYRISNSNVMAEPVEGFGAAPSWLFDYELEDFNDTTTTWTLCVINSTAPSSLTGYVKFFFDGSDTGTFSVTAI